MNELITNYCIIVNKYKINIFTTETKPMPICGNDLQKSKYYVIQLNDYSKHQNLSI